MGVMFLITLACTSFFLSILIIFRKITMTNRNEFIRWGLGVDCCYFHSKSFTVDNQCVTINGFQEVMDKQSAICYSLVKINWWGKREVYYQSLIYGDYRDNESFQIVITNIPNGENYKIEVFNRFDMSYGQFQVKLK